MLISKYGNGSSELIKKFEEEYGVTFDDEYREFLFKYNGGDTPDTTIKKGEFSSDVRMLYGICTKERLDKRNLEDWKNSECIPIAEDTFGNLFSIDISNKNKGSIYFCDHEKGYEKEKVADSFKEFISMCKSKEISDLARSTVEEREKRMFEKGRGHVITEGLRELWKKEYEKYGSMVQEKVIL